MTRAAGWAFLAASLAGVLVLTLTPGAPTDRIETIGICVICGGDGLANLLRNVLLFLPLGIVLGVMTDRPVLAWLGAALLSATIEGVQILLPGRNPLLADLLANATGAGLGVLTGRWALGQLASAAALTRGRSALPFVAWLLAASAVPVATGAAFRLAPPEPPHHVQWTARLAHLAAYEGTLISARLDGRDVPQGRHPEPEWLERRLLDGGVLQLEILAAPPPPRTAPIFSVFTARRSELFLLGVSGSDLVLHVPRRAARMHLDRPDLRLPGALEGVEPGQPLSLGFRMDGTAACLRIRTEETCGLRPTVGEGWALLLFPRDVSPPLRGLLSTVWLLALPLLAGFFAPGPLRAGIVAGAVAGAAALVAAVPWFPVAAPIQQLVLLALGAGAGFGLRLACLRIVSVRAGDTLVATPRQAPRFVSKRPEHPRKGV